MNLLLEPTVWIVLGGIAILCISSSVVGTFLFLQKKSLVGDAVAHSVLPGVCLAFIIAGSKDPLYLLLGAAISGWASLLTMDFILRKTSLKSDAAIAIVLSVYFGLGIVLLTRIQQSGNAAQSGLEHFLFGQAASLSIKDVAVFSVIAGAIIILFGVFFKAFQIFAFNADYAKTLGLPVRLIEFLLSTSAVLVISAGIQAVGVVLIASLLITPALAARFWSSNLKSIIFISCIVSVGSGLAGSLLSLAAPSVPTGPVIVVVLSLIAFASLFFSPKGGVVYSFLRRRRNQKRITKENLLKSFYHLGEEKRDFQKLRLLSEINDLRKFSKFNLNQAIGDLVRAKLLIQTKGDYHLTSEGLQSAEKIVRLHRLWELYLTVRLHLPGDHVHIDAESIEHILTPELEELLIKELDNPKKDPHNSQIPGLHL